MVKNMANYGRSLLPTSRIPYGVLKYKVFIDEVREKSFYCADNILNVLTIDGMPLFESNPYGNEEASYKEFWSYRDCRDRT